MNFRSSKRWWLIVLTGLSFSIQFLLHSSKTKKVLSQGSAPKSLCWCHQLPKRQLPRGPKVQRDKVWSRYHHDPCSLQKLQDTSPLQTSPKSSQSPSSSCSLGSRVIWALADSKYILCSALVPLTALDNSLISVQASRFAVYKQPKWGSPWMFRRQSIQYRALGFHTFSLLIDCPSCSSILSGLPGPLHSSITLSAFPAALSPLSHYSPTSPWLCVCVFTVPCARTTSHSFLCTQHRSQVSTKCSVFAEYPVIIF